MRRILVVKVGSTMPSLAAKAGDFEHWVLSGMNLHASDCSIVDVRDGTLLPSHDELSGVVVTGSHSMVTEHQEWSERTAEWLARCVEAGVPTLGICYGHQLLAYALGGEVGNNPNGLEFGSVDVHLNEEANTDILLGGLPSPMRLHVCHTQSVLRLPHRARRLAFSKRDPNHSFVVGNRAWGMQFHPEFNASVVREYIRSERNLLLREGQDPDQLAAGCSDNPYGAEILKRFAAFAYESFYKNLSSPFARSTRNFL